MNFEDCIKKRLVIKKSVDREMSKSLRKLVDFRLSDVEKLSTTTLKVEAYYEIIKESITALLSLKGYKSYSHECLISFIENNFSQNFSNAEIKLIDQLRVIRNDIAYRGIFVEDDYLIRNFDAIQRIIKKLIQKIDEYLEGSIIK